ncbi:MAG: YbjN domain-containing protein [Geminicoccaceae bacterium]|nr:YbjN domain-containing protein [Geminicoccaceae bacterium]MCS7267151.1 YbjN domain-containing protein [Geminicoccaceae bacterium]MCX7629965.1 YbjN domain-containing protein [Geminicoccaceae bacterium]MDW8124697.1 YbjN domain-containing protein [Geminicoccaceae bacterium]MDW8341538.1 YbjN domain-containing protein [Geminicoccaceae bacterium]
MTDIRPELQGSPFSDPLELVERLAGANEWVCHRHGEDELCLELEGQWCRYELWFSWHRELGVLQIVCALDLSVPARRKAQTQVLLALANEKLLLGHFDLVGEERRPTFRYALLFRDGSGPGPELIEELVELATSECDRFFPAFAFVARGLKSPEEALAAAMLETEGEA